MEHLAYENCNGTSSGNHQYPDEAAGGSAAIHEATGVRTVHYISILPTARQARAHAGWRSKLLTMLCVSSKLLLDKSTIPELVEATPLAAAMVHHAVVLRMR